MTDWNVPDWHALIDYPHFEGPRAPALWGWEFLRRNQDYRNFYIEKMEPLIDPADKEGFFCEGEPFIEMRSRFGIDYPFPPWSTNPAIQLFLSGTGTSALRPVYRVDFDNDGQEPSYHYMKIPQSILVKENEVYFRFDLNLPPNRQFERMKEQANLLLGGRYKNGGSKNSKIQAYINYLRILDAYGAGAHESPHFRRDSYWPNFVDK
jgi:hypothetical protein